MRVHIYVFLTSSLDEDEWLAPEEIASGACLVEGYVNPRIGLDRSGGCGEYKNLLSISGIKSRFFDHHSHSPSLHRLIYPGSSAYLCLHTR